MEEPTVIDPAARTELGDSERTRTAQRTPEDRRLRADVRAKLFGSEPGTSVRIGRFDVEGKLGEGGMGAVYRAHDPELERHVAIKLLTKGAVEGSEGRARLQREARALAKLSHPNVVHVYEVGEHEAQVFVAMELVPGCTLRDWLEEAERSVPELVAMYGQAARGLAAAPGREGFGISLVEAMAAGLPVVATDIPGYREIVRDGVEGLLVPPGDAGALRAAIARLLSDADLAATLGARGRARADGFSWERLLPRIEEIYERTSRRARRDRR